MFYGRDKTEIVAAVRTVTHAEVVELADRRHAGQHRARGEPEVLWEALVGGQDTALRVLA